MSSLPSLSRKRSNDMSSICHRSSNIFQQWLDDSIALHATLFFIHCDRTVIRCLRAMNMSQLEMFRHTNLIMTPLHHGKVPLQDRLVRHFQDISHHDIFASWKGPSWRHVIAVIHCHRRSVKCQTLDRCNWLLGLDPFGESFPGSHSLRSDIETASGDPTLGWHRQDESWPDSAPVGQVCSPEVWRHTALECSKLSLAPELASARSGSVVPEHLAWKLVGHSRWKRAAT